MMSPLPPSQTTRLQVCGHCLRCGAPFWVPECDLTVNTQQEPRAPRIIRNCHCRPLQDTPPPALPSRPLPPGKYEGTFVLSPIPSRAEEKKGASQSVPGQVPGPLRANPLVLPPEAQEAAKWLNDREGQANQPTVYQEAL